MSDALGSEFNFASEYKENLVTKGVVESSEPTKIVEISRSRNAKVIGEGINEGHVRDGVRVKMGRRILNFAEKIFNSDYFLEDVEDKEKALRNIIKTQIRLKKMGFPVVNTMRIIDVPESAEKRLLVTDLTENGKYEILSAVTMDFHEAIQLSNSEEVNNQLSEIYQLLNINRVRLGSFDVPFLIIDKETKRGKIILGDLARIRFKEDESFAKKSIEEYNLKNLQDFARHINDKFLINGELEIKPKTLTR